MIYGVLVMSLSSEHSTAQFIHRLLSNKSPSLLQHYVHVYPQLTSLIILQSVVIHEMYNSHQEIYIIDRVYSENDSKSNHL